MTEQSQCLLVGNKSNKYCRNSKNKSKNKLKKITKKTTKKSTKKSTKKPTKKPTKKLTKKTTIKLSNKKKLLEGRIIKVLNTDYKNKLIDEKTYKMLVTLETSKKQKKYKSTSLLKRFLKENWYDLSDGEIEAEIISKTLWIQHT